MAFIHGVVQPIHDRVFLTLVLCKIVAKCSMRIITSPRDGWVGERQARVGQHVRAGTLLVAVVPRSVGRGQFSRRHRLPRCALAAGLQYQSSRPREGRIESLSPASGAQFALLPADNSAGNFTHIVQRIPVKITLDQGKAGLDCLRLGMSAFVAMSPARHPGRQSGTATRKLMI